jgi:hypothetical protein
MKWKTIIMIIMTAACLLGTVTQVHADDGSKRGYTYNYDYWGDIQYSPDAYRTTGVYISTELGLDQMFNNATGMYVQGDRVYVCDTGNNRIVEIQRVNTADFKLIRNIDLIQGNVEVKTLSEPTDICVSEDGYLYICDKGNNRILKLDQDLNYVMEFTKPKDATFDQSAAFLPDKLEVDGAGRVYCIADNINKGMIKYESDGTFTGFYGASEVTYDWTDYVWKKFATKAQRSALESFVPTEYDNLYMDAEGFIFACTTNVSAAGLKDGTDDPIRRLNLMGRDILIENGTFFVIGDIYWGEAGGYQGSSLITDITSLDNGIYFALDKVRGRVFGYDTQGNMLYAFGGSGNMDGYFKSPSAIEHMGRDLIVLDAQDSSFTVFTPTEYGNLIYKAIEEYDAGDYDASGDTWMQVKVLNGNYDLSYIGIGRALMRQGNYKEAMTYFKLKWDHYNYSKAFKQYRKEWVENHIEVILVIIVLGFILPVLIRKIKRLKNEIDAAEIFNE